MKEKELEIMLIDDEAYALELLLKVREKMGNFRITTCLNGLIALEEYRENSNSFDIIICDLNMPEMNGVEFLRYISDENYSGGIILLSSQDGRVLETAKELAKARNLNVLGYFSKPLKQQTLKLLLSNYSPKESQKKLKILESELVEDSITEEELRSGIDKDCLRMVYQPKMNLTTGEIKGVEALSRWNHIERGLISPCSFIPLAEQCNLIDELTYVIYKKTLMQLKLWQENNIFLEVSINVAVNSFIKSSFADFLIGTAKEYDIEPPSIILEITETQFMGNNLDCLEALLRLRMSHFGLSIDDFGTGHSNMVHLKKIPFTELKIDRSFVTGASEDSSACLILESSIELARKLKMITVAEGVETESELALVKKLGCDQAQGHFIAKSMSVTEFEKFIRSKQTMK